MRSTCSACTGQPQREKPETSQTPRMRPCSYAAGDTHWAGHREWLDRKSYLVSCWRSLLGSPDLNWFEHAHFQSIRFAFLRAGPAPKTPAGAPALQQARPLPVSVICILDGIQFPGWRLSGGGPFATRRLVSRLHSDPERQPLVEQALGCGNQRLGVKQLFEG